MYGPPIVLASRESLYSDKWVKCRGASKHTGSPLNEWVTIDALYVLTETHRVKLYDGGRPQQKWVNR